MIERSFALIAEATERETDLELMTIIRFWGEVLVSVEYGEFWRRMEAQFAAAGAVSRFYHPHHHHDGRDPLATAADDAATHSGRLGACLVRLLDGDGRRGALRRDRGARARAAPRLLRPVLIARARRG